jgi:hypothetical protein
MGNTARKQTADVHMCNMGNTADVHMCNMGNTADVHMCNMGNTADVHICNAAARTQHPIAHDGPEYKLVLVPQWIRIQTGAACVARRGTKRGRECACCVFNPGSVSCIHCENRVNAMDDVPGITVDNDAHSHGGTHGDPPGATVLLSERDNVADTGAPHRSASREERDTTDIAQ